MTKKTQALALPANPVLGNLLFWAEYLSNWRVAVALLAFLAFGLNARAFDEATTVPAADTASVSAVPEINHMVYLSFLPEPADLMADAKNNGLTILRLDRTSDRVVVTYKYPDGHTATLGYTLISAAGQADRVAAMNRPVERSKPVVVTREPEIIYVDRPYRSRVIYRDAVDDFWLPLTVGFGLGWVTNHHSHGYYRGGFRGSHHGGGWHR